MKTKSVKRNLVIGVIGLIITIFVAIFVSCSNMKDAEDPTTTITGTTTASTTTASTTTASTTTASTTTASTTTASTTTMSTTETTTKRREEPTKPVLMEGMEQVELRLSDLTLKALNVNVVDVVFHKATAQTEAEISQYGDDPYIHNHLYLYVKGGSDHLKVQYTGPYAGNVGASAFFENDQLVWHDGMGSLQVSLEEGEATISGFSAGLTEVTHQSRLFQEFLEIDGIPVKMVTFIFI